MTVGPPPPSTGGGLDRPGPRHGRTRRHPPAVNSIAPAPASAAPGAIHRRRTRSPRPPPPPPPHPPPPPPSPGWRNAVIRVSDVSSWLPMNNGRPAAPPPPRLIQPPEFNHHLDSFIKRRLAIGPRRPRRPPGNGTLPSRRLTRPSRQLIAD